MRPSSFSRMRAVVAAAWSCGAGASSPRTARATSARTTSAASCADAHAELVRRLVLADRESDASRARARCPCPHPSASGRRPSRSRLAIAHVIGAAPRYFGKSDACRLMLLRVGVADTVLRQDAPVCDDHRDVGVEAGHPRGELGRADLRRLHDVEPELERARLHGQAPRRARPRRRRLVRLTSTATTSVISVEGFERRARRSAASRRTSARIRRAPPSLQGVGLRALLLPLVALRVERAWLGAAAEAGLVERERLLVRVVRAAAAGPRLGSEAAP